MIQHEIDHLDGVLMLDRISREERKEAMRAMREAQREASEPRRPRAIGRPEREVGDRRRGPRLRRERRAALRRGRPGREPRLAGGSRRISILRTVFLGTSEFAAAVLERLAASDHRPALVLTRPDRPRGRGRRLAAPPVAERARALGIALEQPESVNEPPVVELIAQARPDVVVVCAFGALIKEPLLSEHELLNVHPSLLPRWRGAAPIERAIMAGDERTGVSIMRLTAGLDSGPVCLTAAEPIAPEDTYGSLAARLQEIGGELLVRALDLIAAGAAPAFVEQDEAGVTYAEKIAPEDRLLDPARPAAELERIVRALHPHIGARVALADGDAAGRAPRARGGGAETRSSAGDTPERWLPSAARRRGCCTARAIARWSCSRCSRRAVGAMDAGLRYAARSMPAEARAVCAYAVLRRVFEDGAYADRALHAEAKQLDARDRALAMRLAYGAVQRKGTLDHLIERLAERPPARLDARLLAALRLGLYELLYLRRRARPRGRGRRGRAGQGRRARRSRARQRGAAPRRARGRARCSRELERRDARAGRGQALPSRVDRAPVVGAARRERRARADGLRQRAGRGGAAREHAVTDAATLAGELPVANPRRPATCPRRSCWRARSTRTTRPRGARGRSWRSRARRCSSRGCSIRGRASGCSTCAPRPAARAPTWRR